MRRTFDFLGLTRPKGAPRPRLREVVVGSVGLFFALFGGSLVAGTLEAGNAAPVWIGGALIVLGVGCWITEGIFAARANAAGRPRSPDGERPS